MHQEIETVRYFYQEIQINHGLLKSSFAWKANPVLEFDKIHRIVISDFR